MNSRGERYPSSPARVNLVVVGDPRWQLAHHGLGIRTRTDADVIAFDRAHKSFGHSIALWTFDRRRPGFETHGASEAAGIQRLALPFESHSW